jgi:hypothetical protein
LKEANYSIEHTLEIKTWLEQEKTVERKAIDEQF